MNWLERRRTVALTAAAAVLLLVLAAIGAIRDFGASEVQRAREPVNFAVMDARPAPGDWPWWHGSTQTNVVPFENPPIHWSSSDNGWVVPVSGRGRTGMCIWGDRLFLPAIDAGRDAIDMLCLDPSTGRVLWQTELHRDGLLPQNPRSARVSITPACDGQHVYLVSAIGGSLWVTAVDVAGRIAWQREAGPYFSRWGYASSPAIYKSLVIVAADNKGARINRLVGASYLAALHRQTGEIVWRIRRPEADSSGTPILAHVAGRDQLLMAGQQAICGYDPNTGQTLWTCRWSADRVANSVAFDDQCVYAASRQPQPELVCIRADGSGDVTQTHVVWRTNKFASDLPSPVVYDGRLYTVSDEGVVSCLDAGNGKPVWKRQLGGTVSSTPVIAGGHLYCCTDDGTVVVLQLTGRGEVVAQVPLGEGMFAAPIVSRNRLYLRTVAGVRCVESAADRPIAVQPETPRRRL